MYNEQLKRTYLEKLDYKELYKKNIESMFNICEAFEIKFSRDVSTFTQDMVAEMMSEVGLLSKTKYPKISILRQYAKWCVQNGVSGANYEVFNTSYESDVSNFSKIKRRMIANPKHLQDCLDKLFDPEDACTIDNIYRCYAWFAYAGLRSEQMLKLSKYDVDIDRLTIYCNDRRFQLEPLARKALLNCCILSYFTYLHPNYGSEIQRERYHSNQLMRGIKADMTKEQIKREYNKHKRDKNGNMKCDVEISETYLRLSGVFFRTRLEEVAGYMPDFADFVIDEASNIDYDIENVPICTSAVIKRKASMYLNDYQKWKEMFPI